MIAGKREHFFHFPSFTVFSDHGCTRGTLRYYKPPHTIRKLNMFRTFRTTICQRVSIGVSAGISASVSQNDECRLEQCRRIVYKIRLTLNDYGTQISKHCTLS